MENGANVKTYYITEDQLTAFINAVKKLPTREWDFETADLWVGICINLAKLRDQPVSDNSEDKEE